MVITLTLNSEKFLLPCQQCNVILNLRNFIYYIMVSFLPFFPSLDCVSLEDNIFIHLVQSMALGSSCIFK